MSTELVRIILLIVLMPALFILPMIFRNSHEKNPAQWIKSETLKILSSEVIDREQTPFSRLSKNRSFMFYRVRVSTKEGREKSGYLSVAGQMSPLFSTKVAAKWNDND